MSQAPRPTRIGSRRFDEFGSPITAANNPGTDPGDAAAGIAPGGWETEEALDVEWVHAIAPAANIVLYEVPGPSNYLDDQTLVANLMTAVNTARNTPGIVAVSMSWGVPEAWWTDQYTGQGDWDSSPPGPGIPVSNELAYDSIFTTPAGDTSGVTFLAASGDYGAPGRWPAQSPNVVAVGGTTLEAGVNGQYINETAQPWANFSGASGGGFGFGATNSFGTPEGEMLPSYQSGALQTILSSSPWQNYTQFGRTRMSQSGLPRRIVRR